MYHFDLKPKIIFSNPSEVSLYYIIFCSHKSVLCLRASVYILFAEQGLARNFTWSKTPTWTQALNDSQTLATYKLYMLFDFFLLNRLVIRFLSGSGKTNTGDEGGGVMFYWLCLTGSHPNHFSWYKQGHMDIIKTYLFVSEIKTMQFLSKYQR